MKTIEKIENLILKIKNSNSKPFLLEIISFDISLILWLQKTLLDEVS